MHKIRILILSFCATVVAALALSSSASAARDIQYGFVEDQFADNLLYNGNEQIQDLWWDRLAATNSDLVRLNMYWGQVAPSVPTNPTSPGSPSYNFSIYDDAVREAQERGIQVVFTICIAPRWAQGANPPPEDQYRVGSWKPNPIAFGNFAQAVAKRYSGNFSPAAGQPPLPRVKYFEGWNEPNLPQYLTPQWDGTTPVSTETYRGLINAFYAGIKAGQPGATVVAAGTSPFGDDPGGKRMRPYAFWRQLLCLKQKKVKKKGHGHGKGHKHKHKKPKYKLKKIKGCAGGSDYATMDIYAHNPINAKKGQGPEAKTNDPDNGVPSNFKDLTKIVRAAEKYKTILPGKKHAGWGTETWYESNPPEQVGGVSLKKQAKFMEQAMYVLWRQKVKGMFFLQLQDTEYDPSLPPLVGFQTGIYLPDGKAKPSAKAVAFPFVADRKSKKKVKLWGIAPKKGKVTIKAGKKKVAKIKAKDSKVFAKDVKLKGKAKLVAKLGKKKSLPWKLKAK